MKYFKYFRYVIRHKWFVFLEARRLGIPWLGLIHDLSKFMPNEFIPYSEFFYGKKSVDPKDATGYYKPTDTGDLNFDMAWLRHQKRNKHHWQWWVLPNDDGGFKVFEMPEIYRLEMLADWKGAGRAQGKPDTRAWYIHNKEKMLFGIATRKWIEDHLSINGD